MRLTGESSRASDRPRISRNSRTRPAFGLAGPSGSVSPHRAFPSPLARIFARFSSQLWYQFPRQLHHQRVVGEADVPHVATPEARLLGRGIGGVAASPEAMVTGASVVILVGTATVTTSVPALTVTLPLPRHERSLREWKYFPSSEFP